MSLSTALAFSCQLSSNGVAREATSIGQELLLSNEGFCIHLLADKLKAAYLFSRLSRASAAARRRERLESTWNTFWRSARALAFSPKAAMAEALL